ncbi:23S rRNA (adenine(2503)-C(2))-methyltransferase RlmN [Pseudodesulfovibrio piezophilus]|uniref:Probable dual-specificity RNA methyltransferase RlmN n=1 Tax=Pseudodesulfovibrio piezophilus (strain DSM 21447 / JCM 15486 / C1TLV30) TaxID=1322246 RepID=M1WXA4_PSEP2|nr:23S rRNA (adenine(2503)-C(2))-methyltransferase RlmN [Pseudodesulfovibrio piezophilus]CCH49623.1 Ribosomal RNA large subunit methyltransferase N [Pseudodesulfovibrio piezophilus C1TLV30]
MQNLIELNKNDLEAFVAEDLKLPRFRAEQIWQWLWQKRVRHIDGMTNLSKPLRERLMSMATIQWPEIARVQQSKDGTIKLLLRLGDGKLIETVLIPMQDRYSQCLSTQVGCAMACTFCNTGLLGFERNLSYGEIMGQILVGRQYLEDQNMNPLKNLVFMGMGEPLLNLETLLKVLNDLPCERGLSLSWRRSMVSTVGFPDKLKILGKLEVALPAISLHAPTQELRAKIMPKAAKVHLNDLMAALKTYPMRPRERITFEYLLLKDVNDSLEQADQLARLVDRRKGKINLIAYNAVEGMPYGAPERGKVEAFEKRLWDHGLTAFIRRSMGSDIKAACGQLKADEQQ